MEDAAVATGLAESEVIKLRLQALLEEYKQALAEVNEYTKLTFQMFSIFFVFIGAVVGLSAQGVPSLFPVLQLVVLVFVAMHISMEGDVMIDSAHAASIEARISHLLRTPHLMRWQSLVGNVSLKRLSEAGQRASWYQPLVLILVHLATYCYCIWKFCKVLEADNREVFSYTIGSLLLLTLVTVDAIVARRRKCAAAYREIADSLQAQALSGAASVQELSPVDPALAPGQGGAAEQAVRARRE